MAEGRRLSIEQLVFGAALLFAFGLLSWWVETVEQRVARLEQEMKTGLGSKLAQLTERRDQEIANRLAETDRAVAAVASRVQIALHELPIDIVQRVFMVECQGEQGTCFGIRVRGESYLLTAGHVVRAPAEGRDLRPGGVVQVLVPGADAKRELIKVRPIFCSADVVALAAVDGSQVDVPTEVGLGTEHLSVGQRVHLLGFPHGMATGSLGAGSPLYKSGTVSGFATVATQGGTAVELLIDARVEPGMSGGPVVYLDHHGQPRIAGVIASYYAKQEPIFAGPPEVPCLLPPEKAPKVAGVHVRTNRAFAVACDVSSIVKSIVANQDRRWRR